MAFKGLRDWLEFLKANNELIEINAQVDSYLELGAICRWTLDNGPNKALLFNNIKDYDMPVLANVFGTRERLNMALGVTDKDRIPHVLENWTKVVEPLIVEKEEAACKQVILKDDEVDLTKYPFPFHNVLDGGRYISLGVIVGKDPDSDTYNLSYQRMDIKGPRKCGFNLLPRKHVRVYAEKQWAEGKPLEVAVVIGCDPVIQLATAASPKFGHSEYYLAGALRNEPVRLVKCETIDVMVPADCEMVIEGEVPPGIMENEGPFGEFTGHYGTEGPRPIFNVKAVTHRKDPILQTLYTGVPICDNHIIQEFFRSAKVLEHVKRILPNIKDAYCPPEGGNGFTVYISMKKKHDGEPKLAMMAAWTSFEYVKHVIITDDDVNIYDARQREWAVATRVQANRDVLIIPDMVGMALDPSAQGQRGAPVKLGVFEVPRGTKAVMGIDATKPLDAEFPPVTRVPEELLDKVAERLPELLGKQ